MDLPVIELAHPMPGFPDDARFALVRLDDDGVLHGFRSLDSQDLQFVVVPPAPFYPDYALDLDDETVTELGIDETTAGDVLVLLVVRAGATLADTTVNLRAPLVVNPATRRASQVILDDADLPLAAPLVA
ncbi:flagellar assembly protein FliW [Nocardioides kongjuensis]|uniref:Flagellar assembly factor FliW n=1 Tax=Nocardioides kongjuensis TaxID=349522 RepID=A0A852RQB4_9ACTN|nr:flagellar assembly protein FliW [Nocardioides kongjuensis]NYD31436.1 flagellar assembly factor FliW [Nocardioides kongjuensis]